MLKLAIIAGLLAARALTAACVDEIRTLDDIRYEYQDRGDQTPIIVMVPGFTQHNCSLEFVLLKEHFLAQGFSVLMMNPPQHGEDAKLRPVYDWGERESRDLLRLVDGLGIPRRHPRMHALGFSIGAKTVIDFAALDHAPPLASVIAVAPPYRVGDINMLLSGDIGKPLEGFISSQYAVDRAGYLRILYMIGVGMPKALSINRETPARNLSSLKAPLLLVHGAGDWLIRSNHSLRLFERVDSAQPAALVMLDTRTHAEDMLSRDGSKLRQGLLDVLDRWIALTDSGGAKTSRDQLQSKFAGLLDSVPWVSTHRVDPARISHLDHPTLPLVADGLWYSAPREHAALGGAYFARDLRDGRNQLLLDAAPWAGSGRFLGDFALAVSAADSAGSGDYRTEAALSYYCAFGSALWLRRLGLISGVGEGPRRHILTADLALLVMNFEMNYGEFTPGKQDAEIVFSLPLISSPTSAYFLGGGYSAFFTKPGAAYHRDDLNAFFAVGPPRPILGTRLRISAQYSQEGIFTPGWHPLWTLGFSVSLRER